MKWNLPLKTLSSYLLLLMLPFHLWAQQPWVENVKASKKDPTFFEIKQSFENHWKGKVTDAKGKLPKGKGYKQFKRWEWFWEPRVGKDGIFPKSSVVLDELEKYRASHPTNAQSPQPQAGDDAAVTGSAPPPPSASGAWVSLGPSSSAGGYSGLGRINAIGFHPSDLNTFWVGSPSGGLWKTTNNGASWTTLTDNLPVMGVSAIVVDHTNPNILYIATGDRDAGDTYSVGILKSTNGGTSWVSTGLSYGVSSGTLVKGLIMHPANPQYLLAATSAGIYRTTNGGTTWTLESSGNYQEIMFKPGDPNTVYASTIGNAQIFRSLNAGDTWAQVTAFGGIYRIALAVTPANPNVVGALCSNNTNYGFGGYYSSANSGASFSLLYAPGANLLGWDLNGTDAGGQGWYDLCLAISPTNANIIHAGGVNTWKSLNGGSSWAINTMWYGGTGKPEVHADKHWMAYNPLNTGTLYQCNDGGVYRTSDGGATWTDISNGLKITQYYRMGNSATNANLTLGGTQDNGTKLRNGVAHTDEIGGDGMESIIDYSNANIMYGELYYGDIYKTTNGGASWSHITPSTPSGPWVTPYVIDPVSPSTLYAGFGGNVWKTTNAGASWAAISAGLSASHLQSIAVAPSNTPTIYAASYSAMFKTTNGGASWSPVALPSASSVSSIEVHPTNSQVLWLTFSGYTAGAKVFRSDNGGSTWINVSGTLPNLPTNTIEYDKNTGVLYVGNDLGVFARHPSMADWQMFDTGLPNVIVTELEIQYSTARLRASTYGRGLWESDLITVSATPTITSFTPTSGPAGIGVYIKGTNFTNVSAVRFNGVAATQFYSQSSTSVYAAVPAGATTGKIQVVADGGTATSVGTFTVTASIVSSWTAMATMPTPRSQHGAVATNGRIYTFGGFNSTGLLNSTEIYNPLTNTWSAGAPMPAASRGMSFALGSDGMIYAISGFDGSTAVINTYRYNPFTNTWATINSIPGAVWEGAAAAIAGGKIYVFGGEPAGGGITNATRIYDIATNTWSTGAVMPTGMMQHSAVTGNDGRIYVIGGRASSSSTPSGLVQIYTPSTNTWSAGAAMTIPKTQFGAAKAGDGRIYVVGGKASYTNSTGPFFHTVEIYNPVLNTWVTGPVIRAQSGELEAVNLQGNLYALGGTDGTYRNYNFRLFLAPTITSFTPTSGPAGIGVYIKGTKLNNITAVRFNGVNAPQFYPASSTTMYATVPAGATTGKIEVDAQEGTAVSVGNFTVTASITSVWTAMAPMPTPRSQHGALATNGRIYTFGGWNSTGHLNSTEIYNPSTNTWSAGAPMPAASRGLSFALGSDGMIYAISGYDGATTTINTYRYNPITNTWAIINSIPGAVWEGAAAAIAGGRIYVFGGEPAGGGVTNATRIYDIGTNTWSVGAVMPTGMVQHSAVTGNDGRIYVIGGRINASVAPSGLVQIYTPSTNTWSAGTAMSVPKTQFGAVKAGDGRIYVVGGKASHFNSTGPFFHTVEIYNPATNTWATGPVIRAQSGELEAVNLNGNLYALGGTDGTYRNYNFRLLLAPTITSFTPASGPAGTGVYIRGTKFNNVTAVRFNGVNAPQYYVSSLTTMYATVPAGATTGKIEVDALEGTGTSIGNFTVTTGITSVWTTQASTLAPRAQHGALATNGRIYTFGGFNNTGHLASTEIYNPVTNTWSAGAPMPAASRGMSFALGSDGMIYAISGFDGATATINTYRYNPFTNSWAIINSIPGAVWEGAAAAIAGGRIYVFGGEPAGGGVTNATRIYTIATNTWSVGAVMPVGVFQHSAVTGNDGRIYVIGGRTSSAAPPSNTVQIYNPATNTWSAGAVMSVPKTQFGAVKAGDGRIYVVGGKANYFNSTGPFFHTVEIYNPVTNTWATGPVIPAQSGELEAVNLNDDLYAIGGTDGIYRNYNFRLRLAPIAPSSLTAAAASSTQINLNWTDNSPNEDNFRLERSLAAAGPYALVATLPANTTAFANTGLTAGTTYFYRVRAQSTAGISAYSNVASAATPPIAPAITLSAPSQDGKQSIDLNSTAKGPRLSAMPNPAKHTTRLSFTVAENQQVQLGVFDLRGNLVERIFEGQAEGGRNYQFNWEIGSRAAGAYISRLITKNGVVTERIIVQR